MIERFMAKVLVTEECWLWTAYIDKQGYGRFGWSAARGPIGAHRASYELFVGPIPEGLELDHLCRVRECVNPAHLEPVTRRVNTMRGVSPSARNAVKTHCLRGHEFTEANTYVNQSTGYRTCRSCHRANVYAHAYPDRPPLAHHPPKELQSV